MNSNKLIHAALALFFIAGSACTPKTQTSAKDVAGNDVAVSENVGNKVLPVDEDLTELSRFIAGLPVSANKELAKLSENDVWKSYSEESATAWAQFDKTAEKYRGFSKMEIVAPYDTVKTLFYPFGGPDFLFANKLFPNVERMFLIGLETPGKLPRFTADSVVALKRLVNTYKSAIKDVMQLSFFRTNDMKNDSTSSFEGTTPTMMIFMARSGKQIDKVTLMKLDESGNMVETDGKATAVEIKYHNEGETKERSVTFLSADLSDGGLAARNKAFLKYLERTVDDNCLTFLKSATYLMHKPYFSTIRNFCLQKSTMILQDESGIAYKYLNDGKWDIQLYGTYSKPINLFSNHFQPDYLEAFQKGKAKPLGFRIGYDRLSNLLLAKKK